MILEKNNKNDFQTLIGSFPPQFRKWPEAVNQHAVGADEEMLGRRPHAGEQVSQRGGPATLRFSFNEPSVFSERKYSVFAPVVGKHPVCSGGVHFQVPRDPGGTSTPRTCRSWVWLRGFQVDAVLEDSLPELRFTHLFMPLVWTDALQFGWVFLLIFREHLTDPTCKNDAFLVPGW